MNRKSKLIFSLISLCFSIAVLCFGVYSALSVSYSISGSVSYEIQDVFVELDLSVYRALSTTPVNSATHNQNVSTIKDAGDNISETDFGKLSYTDHKSTYENGVVTNPGQEWSTSLPDLDLTYGSPTENNQGYAFYIVIDIHNLGSEIINAQITAPTSLENTILRDSGNVEITADGTERIVLGLALDDVTKGITSADFTYKITISRGELPEVEPITDMTFAFNEENKTATLISYTGTGGDVVIPETIGYDTTSSMTLTFGTMEDMTSDDMNMMYFYQDLNITLPNQEAQLIENPMLWLNENMGSIQATPQDYFPMTIQTVESYTIDQEEYATLGQEGGNFVFAPIELMDGGLCNSVDVQYGTEGQSFTFNMETLGAALGGDSSPTSLAILDFISKMGSNTEDVLPVTYSNFKYSEIVKGDEYTVTSIGEGAFRNCSNLTSIEIPSNVTSIGRYAFYGCSNLTSIEIPSSVTSIGDYAFEDCSALETVTFRDNSQLESIGDWAFSNCSNLTSIEIPSSVTSIGYSAFGSCDVLEIVTFGENSQLESIGDSAFYNCDALTSIEIPSSVTSIGEWAFYNCNKLGNITVDPSNANYCSDEYGVLFNKDKTKLIQYPVGNTRTQYTIPSSVKSIEAYAFSFCSALETVAFGENSQLESIGERAFSNCSNLTSIEIPSSVTSIGKWAFSNCSKLTSIEIPSSVTSIGSYAFSNCSALETVTFGDADSVWVLADTSNTEITISKYTPQVLATYLTSDYSYCNYTWTKKQSA